MTQSVKKLPFAEPYSAPIISPVAAPEQTPQRFPPWSHALLIAGIGFILILPCFNTGFLTYDDTIHVKTAPQAEAADLNSILTPAANSTYFPVTVLSYSLDQALFQSWMPGVLGSWGPGVRFMNAVYHAAAALVLWRVLLLLNLSRLQALFVAVAFAVHPLACETVCWISERKNTLAALFGFAAMWAWLKASRVSNAKPAAPDLNAADVSPRSAPNFLMLSAAAVFYTLALLSKPSALGLLPVLLLLDLFNAPSGLDSGAPMRWRPSPKWLGVAFRMLPLAIVSGFVIQVNLAGHARTLLPPPGGSIFTAALTDFEILARYLYNLVLPIALSASYYVQPIVSLADWRVAAFGILLAALVALTVRFAARPRVALLGWLWFLGALGPSLNFIAITALMQDRYLYLSMPGLLIVITEFAAGIAAWRIEWAGVFRVAAPAYIALLAALGLVRGNVWSTEFEIFHDAVAKQPLSSFAQNGLGMGYAQAWHMASKNPNADAQKMAADFHHKWIEHWRLSVLAPDADRNLFYCVMANRVAEEEFAAGHTAEAEHFWLLGAYPPPDRPDEPEPRAKCLAKLSALRLAEGKIPEAYMKAHEAVAASPRDTSLLARANASLAVANQKRAAGDEKIALDLIGSARRDLQAITTASKLYADARKALENPVFAQIAPKNN
jgi:hypothetical protein